MSQVALHLLAFGQSQIAVENEDLGNVSLEEIALRKIFPTQLDVHDRLVGVQNEDLGSKTVHAARKKIEFTRTKNTGGLSTGLPIHATLALGDDKSTDFSAQALDGGRSRKEIVVETIEADDSAGTDCLRLVGGQTPMKSGLVEPETSVGLVFPVMNKGTVRKTVGQTVAIRRRKKAKEPNQVRNPCSAGYWKP